MPFHEKVHEFALVKGKNKLVGYHPTLRVGSKGETLIIQHGQVYKLDGKPVTELPDWFNEQLNHCSQEALDNVEWTGHRKPGPKPKTPPPPKEAVKEADG